MVDKSGHDDNNDEADENNRRNSMTDDSQHLQTGERLGHAEPQKKCLAIAHPSLLIPQVAVGMNVVLVVKRWHRPVWNAQHPLRSQIQVVVARVRHTPTQALRM